MKKCAILSMDCLDDFEAYDDLIIEPMKARGWHCSWVSWRKEDVIWDEFDVVVVRTPWDYQEDADAFIKVLRAIDESSAHLENNLATMLWNIDKIYLKELAQHQVAIVPTIWRDTFDATELGKFFEHFATDQIVLKPRVSANADNTFWLRKDMDSLPLTELNAALSDRDFMVQPFVPAVIEEGEYSLFYFNGKFSHAILKTPKRDDFRVQEEHGGRLQTIEPEAGLIAGAEKCVSAISQLHDMPLYARLDLVRFNGEFVLMEAELIEPSLYFNMDVESPKRFARAFVDKMGAS